MSPPPTKKPNTKAAETAAKLKQAEAECLELSGSLEVLIQALDAAWPGAVKSSHTVEMARGWARESLAKSKVAREVRAAGKFTTVKEASGIRVGAIFDGIITGQIGQWGGETLLHIVRAGSELKAPDMIFKSISVNAQLAHLIGEPVRITFTTAPKGNGNG